LLAKGHAIPMTARAQDKDGRARRLMARAAFFVAALALILGMPPLEAVAQDASGPQVRVITLDGAIGPAYAQYLKREISDAPERGVALLIVAMNTPGGLVTSMREMVQDILAAPVPVAVYVSPQGAHAASAGTYILYASHIAAMAPGTTVGAATPIEMGGGLPGPEQPGAPGEGKPESQNPPGKDNQGGTPKEPQAPPGAADLKAVNDLVALIKGLADLRGRNAAWAERAVREAETLTAREALDKTVIDVVANDVSDLLAQIDGRKVKLGATEHMIETKGAAIEYGKIGWTTRLLMIVTDPNVAFLLMTLGMWGLILEMSHPGAVFPGLFGAICLILGLYALSVLPVSVSGAALMLLGIGLMVAEVFTPGFGALGIGGLIAFALGALFLFDTEMPEFRVAWPVVVTVTAATGAFLLLVVGYALGIQRRPVISGREGLIGQRALVTEWQGTHGFVHVEGQRWQAHAREALTPGAQVFVQGIEGLDLRVGPTPPSHTKEHRS
jgi:membrane-bound serine protease (ClpP class)